MRAASRPPRAPDFAASRKQRRRHASGLAAPGGDWRTRFAPASDDRGSRNQRSMSITYYFLPNCLGTYSDKHGEEMLSARRRRVTMEQRRIRILTKYQNQTDYGSSRSALDCFPARQRMYSSAGPALTMAGSRILDQVQADVARGQRCAEHLHRRASRYAVTAARTPAAAAAAPPFRRQSGRTLPSRSGDLNREPERARLRGVEHHSAVGVQQHRGAVSVDEDRGRDVLHGIPKVNCRPADSSASGIDAAARLRRHLDCDSVRKRPAPARQLNLPAAA